MSKDSLPFVAPDPESEPTPTSTSGNPPNSSSSSEPKKEMKRLDVEWQSHVAGVGAREAMANKPDVDVKALMQAMLKAGKVDGKVVPCLDAVVILLAQEISTLQEDENWSWISGYGYQMAVMPWVCLFPDEAFELFEAGDFKSAKAAIFAITKKLSLLELKEFNAWCHNQMNLMNESEGDKKANAVKKQAKRAARK